MGQRTVKVIDAYFEITRGAEAKALLKLGFDKPRELEEALAAGGWALHRGPDGTIDDIDYTAAVFSPDFNAFLPQLGAFVTANSFIVLEDEELLQCRWDFDGAKCTFLDFGLARNAG